jgi:hypothetical protein
MINASKLPILLAEIAVRKYLAEEEQPSQRR